MLTMTTYLCSRNTFITRQYAHEYMLSGFETAVNDASDGVICFDKPIKDNKLRVLDVMSMAKAISG